MTKYRCWDADSTDEAGGLEIESDFGADDAAVDACEKWNDRGAFVDGFPGEVRVRDLSDDALYIVEVGVDYSPDFHAGTPRKVLPE